MAGAFVQAQQVSELDIDPDNIFSVMCCPGEQSMACQEFHSIIRAGHLAKALPLIFVRNTLYILAAL